MKGKKKPLLTTLNQNHIEFLQLCMTNKTYAEIADKMGYKERTVTSMRDDLFRYFKVKNRAALVVAALRKTLIEL